MKSTKRIVAYMLMAALAVTGIVLAPAEKVKADADIKYLDATVDSENHEVTFSEATASCTDVEDLQDKTAWGSVGQTTWYAVTTDTLINERIKVSGTVNLILCDDITLEARKGITVCGSNTLTIYGQSTGTGALYAGTPTGGKSLCAGIGGEKSGCGTITINGGVVMAIGGGSGAGIGGGIGGAGGTITINGGNVIAKGGDFSAGIGGGEDCSGTDKEGSISIYGGVVTATGGLNGAGIGGGKGGMGTDTKGSISIYGGVVTANGTCGPSLENNDNGGAGIGGGCGGAGTAPMGSITISGGNVTANGAGGGAGIGGGSGGAGTALMGSITISDGNVTANGAGGGAGIGGGSGGAGADTDGYITFNGGVVTANGDDGGAGIGGGSSGVGTNGCIAFNGGEVKAKGGEGGAGIGGGNGGATGGEITIEGGFVTSTGGENGAGIGGGSKGSGGKVYVSGGYVEANGSEGAEGIGKGNEGIDSGTLELEEGVVCYDADTMSELQPDDIGYIGARTQHMKTVYNPEEPPVFADYTCKINGKVKIPAGKQVKKVTVGDPEIAKAKKKGKKVIVTGLSEGTTIVTAYGKKGKELGSWVVKVE